MTGAKRQLLDAIWRGHDPIQNFDTRGEAPDAQGWNSDHRYLTDVIAEVRPRLVVEVGVWKGASVLTMARALRDLGLDGVVLAVDTWLGSWEHWLSGPNQYGINVDQDLGFEVGFPRLYAKFVANVRSQGLQDYVVPLPCDSNNAACIVKERGLHCEVMHLDGGHDFEAVDRDLRAWWPLIADGGALIADDYSKDGGWPGVCAAVDGFVTTTPVANFESRRFKALIRKPSRIMAA